MKLGLLTAAFPELTLDEVACRCQQVKQHGVAPSDRQRKYGDAAPAAGGAARGGQKRLSAREIAEIHRPIVDALRRRDTHAAGEVVRSHVERFGQMVTNSEGTAD